jgi:hypothetical protein
MKLRKVLLAVLLAGGVALAATAAGAVNDNKPSTQTEAEAAGARAASAGTRGRGVLWDEIQDGKAKKVQRPGPDRHTTAVWDGCRFHYLTTKIERFQGTDGAMGEVQSDPDPLPPNRSCTGHRNPTPEEMAESRVRTAAANAGEEEPSMPPPPHPPLRN